MFHVFQSTHPRRVWPFAHLRAKIPKRFQSTHPRRVWLWLSSAILSLSCFNPHTHAGCDCWSLCSLNPFNCFNPHTHAGCDSYFRWCLVLSVYVSIHTPTQGVTLLPLVLGLISLCFNPHTHAGCDEAQQVLNKYLDVSIHTPTQGVTSDMFGLAERMLFQSTHPRRVWRSSAIWPKSCWIRFQSTHPRRVWLILIFSVVLNGSFNPHTHAGCDIRATEYLQRWKVSIHTPTQGVTSKCLPSIYSYKFQSTHPRRVWRIIWLVLLVLPRFNPHTHAGCDF